MTLRVALFHELNHIFHAELPYLLLVHGIVGVNLNKRFKGAKVRPTGLQTFDLWVEPEERRN